ncbi:MAG: hypothetical protein ACYTGC_13180, partial [Planctomycetota bacterium]
EARLRVVDLHGNAIAERILSPSRRSPEQSVTLPGATAGWYRAELSLIDDPTRAPRDVADDATFLVLPDAAPPPERPRRFGVIAEPPTAKTAALIGRLGVGRVVVRAPERRWPETGASGAPWIRRLRELEEDGVDVGFLLPRSPRADARGEEGWPLLEGLLAEFGHDRIRRWHLGGLEPTWSGGPEGDLDAAGVALARRSAVGTLVTPWSPEVPPPTGLSDRVTNLVIPHHFRPSAVGELLSAWSDRRPGVTLQLPPGELYRPADRVEDLALRTLHAWRADAAELTIEAPWDEPRNEDDRPRIDPVFGAWTQLARWLGTRQFGGELVTPRGLRIWVATSEDEGESGLIVWSPDGRDTSRLLLGPGSVRVTDLYGNVLAVPVDDGVHEVPVSSMPVFVTGGDPELARFRAAFSLDQPRVPSEHRVVERGLRVHNPWSMPLTGTVSLVDSADWRTTPRVHPIDLAPGETTVLPLTIVPSRHLLAGPRTLEAIVEVSARHPYRFRVWAPLEVGLDDMEVSASWRLVELPEAGGFELVVEVEVANIGNEPLSLVAFLQGQDIGPLRALIGRVNPGQFANRVFRLTEGLDPTMPTRLLVGVDERREARRLTHELIIPALTPFLAGREPHASR